MGTCARKQTKPALTQFDGKKKVLCLLSAHYNTTEATTYLLQKKQSFAERCL